MWRSPDASEREARLAAEPPARPPAPPEVALRTLASAVTFDHEMPAALEERDVPVVAINPEEPPTDVESLERHGVDVVTMTGVGHFPMMEDPGGSTGCSRR